MVRSGALRKFIESVIAFIKWSELNDNKDAAEDTLGNQIEINRGHILRTNETLLEFMNIFSTHLLQTSSSSSSTTLDRQLSDQTDFVPWQPWTPPPTNYY